jgi:hypothetical protein
LLSERPWVREERQSESEKENDARTVERLLTPLQGYLAHKTAPPLDPTAGLCLGPYGGPREGVTHQLFLMSEVPLFVQRLLTAPTAVPRT